MRNYRDLVVWEKAHRLTLAVYKNTKAFPNDERFGLIVKCVARRHRLRRTLLKVVVEGLIERWADSSRLQWVREPSCLITSCWRET